MPEPERFSQFCGIDFLPGKARQVLPIRDFRGIGLCLIFKFWRKKTGGIILEDKIGARVKLLPPVRQTIPVLGIPGKKDPSPMEERTIGKLLGKHPGQVHKLNL